jgi:hypothetical protein
VSTFLYRKRADRSGTCTYPRENLHSILQPMHASALRQLPHRNQLAGVQSPSVNPSLYAIQIHDSHIEAEGVFESTLALNHFERCLSTVEVCRHFAVLLLAFVPAAGGFALAAGWAAPATDLLVIGARIVGEGRENGCGAGLLENLEVRADGEPWRGLAREEN